MSDLTQWTYKRSHSITSGTTLTDYQVKIRVYRTEGTSTGDTAYLAGFCKADFGDIRFTDNDANEIPYWIESVSGTLATIWVKVPSISDTTIWIYYGNESASTTSNGNTTFIFFDDFESGTVSATKWPTGSSSYSTTTSLPYQGTYSATRSGSQVTLQSGTIETLSSHVIEMSVKFAETNKYHFPIFCNQYLLVARSTGYWCYYSGSAYVNFTTYAANTWYKVKLILNKSINTYYVYINDVLIGTVTGNTYFNADAPSIFSLINVDSGQTAGITFDVIRIRKYTATEPTHGDWSTEQEVTSYPLKITITPTSGTDSLSVSYNLSISDALDDFVLNFGDGQEYTTPDTITEQFSKTRAAANGVLSGCTIRNVIPSSDLITNGINIRIKLTSVDAINTIVLSHVAIVEQLTDATGTTIPTEITFNNGQHGCAITGIDTTLYSDWITYTIDSSKSYLVILDISPTSTGSTWLYTGASYYKDGESWNTLDLTHYNTRSFGHVLTSLETRNPAPQTSGEITHTYDTPGTYTVWAEGYNEFATHVYYEIPYGVTVNSQSVTADLAYNQLNDTVTFHDESTGNPSEWFWTFGDGTWSYTQNPIHTYPNTGIYHGTLHASNQYQYDNTTFDITVITVDIDQSKFYICPVLKIELVPHTVTFRVRYTGRSLDGYTLSYTWDFDDGTTESTSSTSISHTYTATGVYYPTCTIHVNEVEINTITGSTILLNIPSKTLYEKMLITDHRNTFYVQILLEYLEMMDIHAPAIILQEKLGMLQRKFREHLGIDEFGHHVTDRITSFGQSIHGMLTGFGRKITKVAQLNQRGFTTCDFIVLEETITLEHDIESISEFAT